MLTDLASMEEHREIQKLQRDKTGLWDVHPDSENKAVFL